MSDEQFLGEVLRYPDDDGPRLVYADWLEEQGDPRGEFIRLQIQRSRLPVGSLEAVPLRAREQALLKQHGRQWAGPVAKIAEHHQFSRGFVESVNITLKSMLRKGDVLFASAPIRDVGLLQCDNRRLQTLAAREQLQHLTGLRLGHCRIGSQAFETLLGSLQPEKLDTFAIRTHFGRRLSEVLANSDVAVGLRAVSITALDGMRHSNMDVGRIVRATPLLEYLGIPTLNTGADEVMAIASADLKRLRYLEIHGGIQLVGNAEVDAVLSSNLPLEWLSLAGDNAACLIDPIEPRLTRLELHHNNLSGHEFEALVQAKHLAGLKYLDLTASRELTSDCLDSFLNSSLFAGLDFLCLTLSGRQLSTRAFESVVRAWKEQQRPVGNLFLIEDDLYDHELQDLRERYGERSFVDWLERPGDNRLEMQMLMPGETSLDVIDGWKREAG